MRRFFVTGTDTDIGKTRVTAALALALRRAGDPPTIVKLVQTGLAPGENGDAARAGRLADTRFLELARFRKAADPWSAALAENAPLVSAADLARTLDSMTGALVIEGAGGLAVPLNARENFGDVASRAKLPLVIAVGLRLGCLNHALLTLSLCEQAHLPIAGLVLVERWGAVDESYRADVARTLQGKGRLLGIMPFAQDEAVSVADGAALFASLMPEG